MLKAFIHSASSSCVCRWHFGPWWRPSSVRLEVAMPETSGKTNYLPVQRFTPVWRRRAPKRRKHQPSSWWERGKSTCCMIKVQEYKPKLLLWCEAVLGSFDMLWFFLPVNLHPFWQRHFHSSEVLCESHWFIYRQCHKGAAFRGWACLKAANQLPAWEGLRVYCFSVTPTSVSPSKGNF